MDPEDERRLARLEQDVAALGAQQAVAASDASAARVLAAGADRDVSEVRAELRAHTLALNALRQTQLEQGRRLDGLDQRFDGLDQRFDGSDQRLDGLDQRLDGLDQRLDGLDQRLDGFDQRFDTVEAGLTQIIDLLGGRS